MKCHLIMPMGGNGSRFREQGFYEPKPLLPLHGKPFFYWATESVAQYNHLLDITFVVLREHVERFALADQILTFYPQGRIVVLDHVLDGAVLTCLEGIRELKDDSPLIFNDCDHMFASSQFNRFLEDDEAQKYTDGALLTFEATDPKYSYLVLDGAGRITRTVEKKAVSANAICGAYYFRNRELFEPAAKRYLEECEYSEYFMSGVYNVLARQKSALYSFDVDFHIPFGTPEEYAAARKSKEKFMPL